MSLQMQAGRKPVFFVSAFLKNHRPALLSNQLTQDQQACHGAMSAYLLITRR